MTGHLGRALWLVAPLLVAFLAGQSVEAWRVGADHAAVEEAIARSRALREEVEAELEAGRAELRRLGDCRRPRGEGA